MCWTNDSTSVSVVEYKTDILILLMKLLVESINLILLKEIFFKKFLFSTLGCMYIFSQRKERYPETCLFAFPFF